MLVLIYDDAAGWFTVEAVDGPDSETAGALGFRPVLDTSGPVDSAVPDDIVPEILAVVREALTNAARHAMAHTVRVSVRAADGQPAVVVQDDGTGGCR